MSKLPCRPEADRALVMVAGPVRFADWPLLRRKMDALTKYLKSPVIATTARPGAEEFAEAWALSRWFTIVRFHEGTAAMLAHARVRRRAFAVVFSDGRDPEVLRTLGLLRKHKFETSIIKV